MDLVVWIKRWNEWNTQNTQQQQCEWSLHSLTTPLLFQPYNTLDDFAQRGLYYAAPIVWNSLPNTVVESPSLTVFKCRLKTFLFDVLFAH